MANSNPSFPAVNVALLEDAVKKTRAEQVLHRSAITGLQNGQIDLRRELSEEKRERGETYSAIIAAHKSIDRKLERLTKWHHHPAVYIAASFTATVLYSLILLSRN